MPDISNEHRDLSRYRLERSKEDLTTAIRNFDAEDYRAANNRAYYAIFHALRAVLALDAFDSKKHSGIISEFRRRYIKEAVFPAELSKMIDEAFEIRTESDYVDLFIPDKEETKKQIDNARHVVRAVETYLSGRGVQIL